MARNILSLGTALFIAMSIFGSTAQACISCNYVPEVVHTPVRGQPTLGVLKKQRAYAANAKKQASRERSKQIAKAAPTSVKKNVVAEAKPTKSVAVVSKNSAPVVEKVEPPRVPVSVASVLDSHDVSTEETQDVASQDVGCKKFFPAVGMTLSVACE